MFDRVVIIGSGRLACECAETAISAVRELDVIESACPSIGFLKGMCKKQGLNYRQVTDTRTLSDWFMATAQPTLVVSAYNSYIFPRPVVEHDRLRIVNFHNSLLPRHRGRNACTWAIYDMDATTGITWHHVGVGIDDGDIIVQRTLDIGPLTTALELTDRCLQLGAAAFRDIVRPLVRGDRPGRPQPPLANCDVVHRGADVPNNGLMDIGWPIERISAFLRSLDYGPHRVFEEPRVAVGGGLRRISGYRIVLSDQPAPLGRRIILEPHGVTIREHQATIEVSFHG